MGILMYLVSPTLTHSCSCRTSKVQSICDRGERWSADARCQRISCGLETWVKNTHCKMRANWVLTLVGVYISGILDLTFSALLLRHGGLGMVAMPAKRKQSSSGAKNPKQARVEDTPKPKYSDRLIEWNLAFDYWCILFSMWGGDCHMAHIYPRYAPMTSHPALQRINMTVLPAGSGEKYLTSTYGTEAHVTLTCNP